MEIRNHLKLKKKRKTLYICMLKKEWHLLCYVAGLHGNVCARIPQSDHKNSLVLKYIWMLILLAMKVLCLKGIYT